MVRFRVVLPRLGKSSTAIAALQWQNGLTYDLQESFFLLGDLRSVELQAGGSVVLRAVEAGDVILEPLPECRLNDEACSGFADTDKAGPDVKHLSKTRGCRGNNVVVSIVSSSCSEVDTLCRSCRPT